MDHQCHSQYYQRTIPGYASVRGSATNTATVTVNSNPAWRHDDYFYGGDTADNSASALMKELEIVATHSNLYSAATGHVFVAQTPEQFIYDADGNLLSDGRWQYTWNGENRLIKAEELVSSTNRQPYAVYYAYDYRGRMAWKTIAPSTGPSIKTTTYVWDDYNIIAEHTTTADTTNTTYNVWGLDLSGTLQGAGGVGGLIAVAQSGTGGPPVVHTPANDANGNITEYVSEDGTLAAHYEYSPFGEIIAQSGDLASTFTHRFSTKPWCAVTGLSEYEFRKYSPSMGRWMNRDPLGEHGGFHLFLSLDNNVVNQLEVLGLLALGTVKERINKLTITCDFDVYICICVNCQSCEYYPLPGWKNIETVLQQEIERKKFVWNRNEAGKELFDQLKRGIINEALGKIIEAIAASLGIAYPNIPDVELLLACINYVKPPNNAFEDLQENGNYYEYLPSIVTAKTKLYKHYCQLPECNKKREGRIYGVATKCGDEIWVPGEWNAGVLYRFWPIVLFWSCMVRNIFARTPALILLCLGIPCFVFPESTKSGSQPSSVAQASYSVDDLTNLFAAARAAYNSYKPETALAYYETAKQMSASLTCVEMEMREFKLKYRAYEHWCKNRATALDLLDFISVYNTLNSNREYEQILSIISEAPTNLPATTLDAMRNAAASSMQNRPGVTKIVMPTESGVLQTNIVRCFARLPFQTNMLASSDNKFLVKWIELQGTQSNRLVLVDNVTQRHHAIMDCLWDVTVIWSPAGKYLAVEENLADNDASVVRLVDVAKPDDVFCVNRCLPESIRQETKDAPVRLTLVKWISDECLNLFCEPSKQNGEYKCWLLRLMKINGEWVLDVMD